MVIQMPIASDLSHLLPYKSFLEIQHSALSTVLDSVRHKPWKKPVIWALVYPSKCGKLSRIDIHIVLWPPEPRNPSGFFVSAWNAYEGHSIFSSFGGESMTDRCVWWLRSLTTQFQQCSDLPISIVERSLQFNTNLQGLVDIQGVLVIMVSGGIRPIGTRN
jgi:hypothetical protein